MGNARATRVLQVVTPTPSLGIVLKREIPQGPRAEPASPAPEEANLHGFTHEGSYSRLRASGLGSLGTQGVGFRVSGLGLRALGLGQLCLLFR